MKLIRPLHFIVPAAALLAAALPLQASPGHSAVNADYHSPALPAPDASVSVQPYDAFGFATGDAVYQTVGDLDKWINRGMRYYNQRQGQRSRNGYYNGYGRNSRAYGGYYPNDPDDRNNPRHPDYIGPPGSYPRYRGYAPSYHPNDPDDRNNPNHPDYIGPPRWRR